MLPALDAAERALSALNKNDIVEIKTFVKPPALVQVKEWKGFGRGRGGSGCWIVMCEGTPFPHHSPCCLSLAPCSPCCPSQLTMEGVCILLQEKPDWDTAKKVWSGECGWMEGQVGPSRGEDQGQHTVRG